MAAARCMTRRWSIRSQGGQLRWLTLQARYDMKARQDGFLADECQTRCIERLSEIRHALMEGRNQSKAAAPRGLYMYGGVGTGKTMMLDLFHEQITADGFSCHRQHFHEFLQAVHLRLHKLRKRIGSQRNLLRLCAEEYTQEFSVLAFDEAHVLNVGDALMLRTFFEGFFDAGGVMVATSNVAPDDLYASGINREVFLPFLDSLREKTEFFQMQGRHDYREAARAAGRMRGIFLWRESELPAGLPCPDQFAALNNALDLPPGLSSSLSDAVDIDVGFGRTLRCDTCWTVTGGVGTPSQASRRVLHFSFDDLCRTAKGPSEWVGVADYCDAIIVTDVPHFEVHDEDAARRFITFVDIIYDKQRFLVVTAAKSPDGIFSHLIERYGGDATSISPKVAKSVEEEIGLAPDVESAMKMPGHGLGSGRHGVIFQKPKQLNYTSSGAYMSTPTDDNDAQVAVKQATSTTKTGGRAEHGVGDKDRVMTGVVQEDSDWVEWSATGLKDASLFDLSPTETHTQVTDKLLPFRRCASRLHQMQISGNLSWMGADTNLSWMGPE